ncbi:MAG: uridine-cytidine kinase [Cyclobacteriaceae bacterium]|nr:uridine-cytidine kinase [Cyclobacteriaceae bacterium]
MYTPYIIGITGGSASGKTQFLNELIKEFDETQLCLISQDNYYRTRNEQPIDENGVRNFDTPSSIDFVAFANDIIAIKNRKKVSREEYTFNNPNHKPKMLEYKPAPIIVVEGIFVLYYPETSALLDLKLFIDTKEHLKLKRRIIRDNKERGYDLEDVLYRYENHVYPTYEKYILPYKSEADIIIPNNTNFNNALSVVISHLKEKLMGQANR